MELKQKLLHPYVIVDTKVGLANVVKTDLYNIKLW